MLTRIAPTPSGFLHRGNGANFLLADAIAKGAGGKLLLRVDDLDRQRVRDAYIENIFTTLAALGIVYDLGPRNKVETELQWSQQFRLPLYEESLSKLQKLGLLYACTCSRKRIRETAHHGVYDGNCRELGIPLDQPGVAWRIRVPKGTLISIPEQFTPLPGPVDLAQSVGDFVVRKKDGTPAYQLSSVVDDLHFGVTDIVRGKDLFLSSAAQIFLAECLGETEWITRIRMYHHPLLPDPTGEKLSKRAGAKAILGSQTHPGANRQDILREVQDWLAGQKNETLLRAKQRIGQELTT